MTVVSCPGTFDPITLGHESLIGRAAQLFDEVIVAVAAGVHKQTVFTHAERLALARESFASHNNIRVLSFDGLLADFLRGNNCRIVIRGLRMLSDFEFETQFAGINKTLAPGAETLLMMPNQEFLHISSSLVREIALLGGDVEKFVAAHVAAKLREKIQGDGKWR